MCTLVHEDCKIIQREIDHLKEISGPSSGNTGTASGVLSFYFDRLSVMFEKIVKFIIE